MPSLSHSKRFAPLVAALAAVVGSSSLFAQTPTLRVIEIRGAQPGPTVAFVAGVHGGKVSASIALERLAKQLQAQRARLRGRVRIVPVANEAARAGGLAQLGPDSLNLNRVFPGRTDGRPTERLAARILYEVVAGADYLVDMHGSDGEESVGRFAYAARPGIRPAIDSAAFELAIAWGTPLVVRDTAGPRTLATSSFLQTAAHLSRVPAITVFEAGAERESEAAVEAFLRGAERVLGILDVMVMEPDPVAAPAVFAARAVTVAPADGGWSPAPGLRPGSRVKAGESLGHFADTSAVSTASEGAGTMRATADGVVLHLRRPSAAGVRTTRGTPLVIIAIQPVAGRTPR